MPDLTVFISHTTQDPRDFARAHEIADGLHELGVQVWIAPESIPAGSEWEEQLVAGLFEKCRYFLVLLTPASSRAEWVLREIELARQRYAKDKKGFTILPISVGTVENSAAVDFLRRFQTVPYKEKCAEQVYLIAVALGISVAPVRLADPVGACAYLDNTKRRILDSLRPLRRMRAFSPLIGLAVYAPVTLLAPDQRSLAALTLLCGPLVTLAIAWGATTGRIRQGALECAAIDTIRDGISLCASEQSPTCDRLWAGFWEYVEKKARIAL